MFDRITRAFGMIAAASLLFVFVSPDRSQAMMWDEVRGIGEQVNGHCAANLGLDSWLTRSSTDVIRLHIDGDTLAFLIRTNVGEETEVQLFIKAEREADTWKVVDVRFMRHHIIYSVDAASASLIVENLDPAAMRLRARFEFDATTEADSSVLRVRSGRISTRR